MKVKSIKKNKGLYEVSFEEEIIKYHEEVIIKYNLLKNNIELSNEDFQLSLLDNRYFLCRDKAFKYITNLRFISKLTEYLLKYEGYFIVNRVVLYLVENKYVDDYVTSTEYVISKYNSGYGSIVLKRKLKELKVSNEIIQRVINENRDLELDCLTKYTNKVSNSIKSLNKNDLKKKIESRLITHGYSSIDIKNIISDIINVVDEKEYNTDIIDKYIYKAINKYQDESDSFLRRKKIIGFLFNKGFEINDIKNRLDIIETGE